MHSLPQMLSGPLRLNTLCILLYPDPEKLSCPYQYRIPFSSQCPNILYLSNKVITNTSGRLCVLDVKIT